MGHLDEDRRGIDLSPRPFGLFQVQENTAWVWRWTWGSRPWSRATTSAERAARSHGQAPGSPKERRVFERYNVTHEGWAVNLPLVMDNVGTVPLEPRLEDILPVEVNVANGQKILFNMRCQSAVGELNWNEYEADPDVAEKEGYVREAQEARRRGRSKALILDPVDPFNKEDPVLVTDAAIIRAALRVKDSIWYHVGTAFAGSVNEAAQALGIGAKEPLEVENWLSGVPPSSLSDRLPLAGGLRESMLMELSEQTTVMACRSLRPFGICVLDVRLEGITIPDVIIRAAELEQVARRTAKAADHIGEAAAKLMRAGGMGQMSANPLIGDSWAQASAFKAALASLDARAGVDSRPAPFVQIGDVTVGGSGGSPKGPGPGKPGGSGAPRKRR